MPFCWSSLLKSLNNERPNRRLESVGGFHETELETSDRTDFVEPEDEIEVVVGEPATVRLARRLTCDYFMQHAICTLPV